MEKFKGEKYGDLKDLISRMKKTKEKEQATQSKSTKISLDKEEEKKKDTLTKETMERLAWKNSIIGAVNQFLELTAAQTKMKKRLKEEAKKKEEKKRQKELGINVKEEKEKVVGPETFYKIDIRVGKILKCEPHEESEKLYVSRVDIGESATRKIGSGVKKFVPIEEMSGLCIIVANLKPKRMADFDSHGMMLFAHDQTNNKFELIRPPEGTAPGERCFLEGINLLNETSFNTPVKLRQKDLLACAPDFLTNDKYQVEWKGSNLKASTGNITCKSLQKANIE